MIGQVLDRFSTARDKRGPRKDQKPPVRHKPKT
jgi:hypothetical protein